MEHQCGIFVCIVICVVKCGTVWPYSVYLLYSTRIKYIVYSVYLIKSFSVGNVYEPLNNIVPSTRRCMKSERITMRSECVYMWVYDTRSFLVVVVVAVIHFSIRKNYGTNTICNAKQFYSYGYLTFYHSFWSYLSISHTSKFQSCTFNSKSFNLYVYVCILFSSGLS